MSSQTDHNWKESWRLLGVVALCAAIFLMQSSGHVHALAPDSEPHIECSLCSHSNTAAEMPAVIQFAPISNSPDAEFGFVLQSQAHQPLSNHPSRAPPQRLI